MVGSEAFKVRTITLNIYYCECGPNCILIMYVFYDDRPLAHLFGHVHECNGLETLNGTVFSNAALKFNPSANVIDVYMTGENLETITTPTYCPFNSSTSGACIVM